MKLYGICADMIRDTKIEGVKELLRLAGAYDECMTECKTDQEIKEWLSDYETEDAYIYGIGALIYDAIRRNESCDVNIDDPWGSVYVGLHPAMPWSYSQETKEMSEESYNAILSKYVKLVTDVEIPIQWWTVD